MAKNHKKQNLFPWREDCRFELLIDGKEFFPHMLEAINNAHKYILFENYLIQSGSITDKFIHALIEARRRGVSVRLIFDDYGAKELMAYDRQRLLQAGIEHIFYNPLNVKHLIKSLQRDHRKIMIVDGVLGFVGGAGITDEFIQGCEHTCTWHDVMVQIRGPVLKDWINVFQHTWKQCNPNSEALSDTVDQIFENGLPGRVAVSKGPYLQEINRSLIKRFRTTERRIWIMTPYFISSIKIRRELKKAARRGIDVRLVLPGQVSDHPWITRASQGFYYRLLKNGIQIFELQHRFPHAKVKLCDNWVSIGSSNLDRWNQRWNLDANQEIDGSDFADQVRDMFLDDFRQCHQITVAQWRQRSLLHRLKEWFWGQFVVLLERFLRNHQK